MFVVPVMATNDCLSPSLEPIKMYMEESKVGSKVIFITCYVGFKNVAWPEASY